MIRSHLPKYPDISAFVQMMCCNFLSIHSRFGNDLQGPLPLALQALLPPPSLQVVLGAALASLPLWDLLEVTSLPSRLPAIRHQLTIACEKHNLLYLALVALTALPTN